jgi:hypothetical protein
MIVPNKFISNQNPASAILFVASQEMLAMQIITQQLNNSGRFPN